MRESARDRRCRRRSLFLRRIDIRVPSPINHAFAPQVLFEGPFELETGGFRNFDVTRDGQRFIMVLSEDEPLDRLVFVVNWAEDLKRLVPSR
jgi:hypothetical protein